jgi:DNA-binding NarL/FixJ family response regulator
MARLFVSPAGQARRRWEEAFPGSPVAGGLDAVSPGDWDSLWLDLAACRARQRAAAVAAALAAVDCPVIAMVGAPSDAEAFALLQAGARGYCHVEAAPEQLREIAVVAEHGGFWMPPELTRRILALSAAMRPAAAVEPVTLLALDQLTAREFMVAQQVAQGASNREIAETLSISERTVKSHLTAIFDKLGLRDRVQLALAMNNMPTAQ